jgi:Co/Zn/Cd efflux system component
MSDHGHHHPVTSSGYRFLVFCLIELASGIMTANSALVTSGLHDMLDGISMVGTGRFDARWSRSSDHGLYCTSRGLLGVGMAILIPAFSALGLLIESRQRITTVDLIVAITVGGCSLALNLYGLIETRRHHDRLHLGYLSHFAQDALGSVIVITASCWAFTNQEPKIIWYGSIMIIAITGALGIGSAIHTLRTIGHRAENHDHAGETLEEHLNHAHQAAS